MAFTGLPKRRGTFEGLVGFIYGVEGLGFLKFWGNFARVVEVKKGNM